MIEEIKKEMLDYFGIILTNKQIEHHIKQQCIECFDTLEREMFINKIALEITNKHYPCNTDSDYYCVEFFKELKDKCNNYGYNFI